MKVDVIPLDNPHDRALGLRLNGNVFGPFIWEDIEAMHKRLGEILNARNTEAKPINAAKLNEQAIFDYLSSSLIGDISQEENGRITQIRLYLTNPSTKNQQCIAHWRF